MPDKPGDEVKEKRRAEGFLVAGALLGLLAAILGVFTVRTPDSLVGDEPVAALVDGVPITRAEYQRALQALERDKRNPLAAADRERVLRLLIDEQLLVQRGVDINLVEASPEVRKALVDAMLQYILADAGADEATEQDLRNFYKKNAGLFVLPERVHVRHLYVRPGTSLETQARLDEIGEALQEARSASDFADVAGRLGDDYLPPVPDGPLAPGKLRDYLGAQLTAQVLALPEGAISEPVETDTGWHIFTMVERQAGGERPFEDVRGQVLLEYRRFLEEQAFNEYLDWLYNSADVRILEDKSG